MRAKNGDSPVRTMCEVGMLAAFGFVLDELAGVLWKGVFFNGGSISIAMIAVVVVAYRRGFFAGLLTGFIMGILDLATGPYMIASGPWQVLLQVLLDYVLAYPLVASCAAFIPAFRKAKSKKEQLLWLCCGVALGGLLKLGSHVASGMLFWADPGNAWKMNPYVYAFLYNFAYVAPSTVLSGAVLAAVYYKAPFLFMVSIPTAKEEKKESATPLQLCSFLATTAVGLASSIAFGILYVRSCWYEDYGEYGKEVSFDANYMMLFAISLLLFIIGVVGLVYSLRKKSTGSFLPVSLASISAISLIFAIARLIKSTANAEIWVFWLSLMFFLTSLFLALSARSHTQVETTKDTATTMVSEAESKSDEK